jgi:hypothetical protein
MWWLPGFLVARTLPMPLPSLSGFLPFGLQPYNAFALTPGLPSSWPAILQPLALVTSRKLGLRQFLFIVRNIKNPRKSQNRFQWITKHVFWQDYFLHIWYARKAKHFEPIEHNCFVQWLKKWDLCLATLSFKISRLWHFVWFSFPWSSSNEHVLS